MKGDIMKQYKGITIERASMNSSGIRWTASTGNGLVLKADTLEGIKQLISNAIAKPANNAPYQALHNHPQDILLHENCPRCILNSAAPQVLEALQGLLIAAQRMPQPVTHDGLEFIDAIAQARTAIRKATFKAVQS